MSTTRSRTRPRSGRSRASQPFGGEALVLVDVDLDEPPGARVDETVGEAGGGHRDLAGGDEAPLVAEGERRLTLQDHEHLRVLMAVQRRTVAGLRIDCDHRHAGTDLLTLHLETGHTTPLLRR